MIARLVLGEARAGEVAVPGNSSIDLREQAQRAGIAQRTSMTKNPRSILPRRNE